MILNTSSFSESVIKPPSSNHNHYSLKHKNPLVIQITHPPPTPPNLLNPHPTPHIIITPHAPLTQTTTTSSPNRPIYLLTPPHPNTQTLKASPTNLTQPLRPLSFFKRVQLVLTHRFIKPKRPQKIKNQFLPPFLHSFLPSFLPPFLPPSLPSFPPPPPPPQKVPNPYISNLAIAPFPQVPHHTSFIHTIPKHPIPNFSQTRFFEKKKKGKLFGYNG